MLEKLHKMMGSGELTPYLYERALVRIGVLPADMQEQMLKDAAVMSGLGVKTEDDHKHFMYVAMHIKRIASDISPEPISEEQLAKISSIVFEDRATYPIDTIFNFYKAADRAMRNLDIPIKKVAYPIGLGVLRPDNPRDVTKWMHAMREIYARVHRGMTFDKALDKVTSDWDIMEKHDFKAWQRFYQEGTHNKYKTADSEYYQAQDGSPLLPLSALRSKMPGMPDVQMLDLPPEIAEEKKRREDEAQAVIDERNLHIEDIKKKLISRLTSAERLITDRAARDELNTAIEIGLEKWLEMLHTLKRSIQTAPMRSAASPILEDLIVRRGNQLISQGHVNAGELLISLAVDPAPPAPDVATLEPPGEEEPPEGEAAPPAPPEGDPLADIPLEGEEPPGDDAAMKDFVRRMNHEHFEDELPADDDDELVVEAQAVAEDPLAEPLEELAAPPGGADIEVEDEPIMEGGDSLDVALANITIEDVIARLETVSSIIQNREIPRQLSFVDMMMGKLGIATFFPSLGEAIRSALESHQYMYTRIEDIQSKLRGSVQPAQPIDLTPDETAESVTSETLESVRQNLAESERRDTERAEQRRARREAREAREVAPEAAPAAPPAPPEELAGPVEVESAPPVRAT